MMPPPLIYRRRWVRLFHTGLLWLAASGQVIAGNDDQGVQPPPCRPIPITPGLLPGLAWESHLAEPSSPARLDHLAASKRAPDPRDAAASEPRVAQRTAPQESVEQVFGDTLGMPPSPTLDPDAAESKPMAIVAPSGAGPSSRTADGSSNQATAAQPSKPPQSAPVATQPPKPRPMPASVRAMRLPLRQCLQWYSQKPLNTRDDSPWSVMHSLLGGGSETQLCLGGPRGKRVSAARWLLNNQPCAGYPLFLLADDRIRGRQGPGFQGHAAQCLAIIAQSGIPENFPLKIGGRKLTVADLIEEEQHSCVVDMELTFKLIGFSFYLDSDARWENDRGESWDFPKLIRLELAQPVNGVTCGGTHRLMGLTCAVARRKVDGKPIDGQFWRADKFVRDYHLYTLTLQNRDGGFSTDWFRRRADSGSLDRKLQTTGHMLEWLVYSVPDEMLYDARVVRAVGYLTNLMTRHRYQDWQVGYRGHAIRALRLYHERVFGPLPARVPPLAGRPSVSPAGGSMVKRLFGSNR